MSHLHPAGTYSGDTSGDRPPTLSTSANFLDSHFPALREAVDLAGIWDDEEPSIPSTSQHEVYLLLDEHIPAMSAETGYLLRYQLPNWISWLFELQGGMESQPALLKEQLR